MELWIIRHGPAEARDARRWPDDADRPLTEEGRRESQSAARGFARLVDGVDRIISSPATRARATAEIFRAALDPKPALLFRDELSPGASASEALAGLSEALSEKPRCALVGHEPTLGELLALAVTGEAIGWVRLAKAGAAELTFPRSVRPAGAELNWLLTRRQLGRLGA